MGTNALKILKRHTVGRVSYRAEQREAILDEFERSRLKGAIDRHDALYPYPVGGRCSEILQDLSLNPQGRIALMKSFDIAPQLLNVSRMNFSTQSLLMTILIVGSLFTLSSCSSIPVPHPTNETISEAKFPQPTNATIAEAKFPQPTNATIAEAKFPQPTNEKARSEIMSCLYKKLKDPDSALIRNLQVGEFGAIKLPRDSATFGYKVSFSMNCKNGMGAYRGYHDYSYLVTKEGAIEMLGVYMGPRGTYPAESYQFYSESSLRRNAPTSQMPTGS
jgi:hypothetical protein